MRKKIPALLLAACMLFGLLPLAASAAGTQTASEIISQISSDYSAAQKAAGRSSFNGWCGMYVGYELLVNGINTYYEGKNGNNTFDYYAAMNTSSGGWNIASYYCSTYSLKDALEAVASSGSAYNIVACFSKGVGTSGQIYGHTLYIQAIIGDTIYYSESFPCAVGGSYHAEGTPIVCSIDDFVNWYVYNTNGKYAAVFEGLVHFTNGSEPEEYTGSDDMLCINLHEPKCIGEGDSYTISGVVISQYSDLKSVDCAVYDSNGNRMTGGTTYPQATTYELMPGIDNLVRFGTLSPGTYELRLTAKNSSASSVLISKTFTVESQDSTAYPEITPVNRYKSGQFSDVNENKWYGASGQGVIKSVYEDGLMKGYGDGTFAPDSMITEAEVITLSAILHSEVKGDNHIFDAAGYDHWYDPYVSYVVSEGMVETSDFDSLEAPASREKVAFYLCYALPGNMLSPINETPAVPDVQRSYPYSYEIYKLYKAGILTGSDGNGTFNYGHTITRAEVAALVARLAHAESRIKAS
ncbi:MAG: S-layer homology domain-containing protein [Oscillospiraceae bacterium]